MYVKVDSEQDEMPEARLRGLLQAAENAQHRRRQIRVVMNDPPLSRFTTIDVRDALLDGDLLSGNRDLPGFDTHFVGHVPSNLDTLVAQLGVASRGEMSHLLERTSDFVPPDLPTADRMHRRDGRAVRPDATQRSRIAIDHAAQRRVELC